MRIRKSRLIQPVVKISPIDLIKKRKGRQQLLQEKKKQKKQEPNKKRRKHREGTSRFLDVEA